MSYIKVQYFASLREKAGRVEETLEVGETSYGQLYEILKDKYQFTLPSDMVQVAVNDEFSSMHKMINSGDKVVFIPPVAGG